MGVGQDERVVEALPHVDPRAVSLCLRSDVEPGLGEDPVRVVEHHGAMAGEERADAAVLDHLATRYSKSSLVRNLE